jgi:hypothetical protein
VHTLPKPQPVLGIFPVQVKASQRALAQEKETVTGLRGGVQQAMQALDGLQQEVKEKSQELKEVIVRAEHLEDELEFWQHAHNEQKEAREGLR